MENDYSLFARLVEFWRGGSESYIRFMCTYYGGHYPFVPTEDGTHRTTEEIPETGP